MAVNDTPSQGFFSKFTNKVTEVIDRRRLIGEVHVVSETLEDSAQISIQNLEEYFGKTLPTSREGRSFVDDLSRAIRFNPKTDWVDVLDESVDIVRDHLKVLEGEITRKFSNQINADDMTYRQANICLYLGIISQYLDALSRTTTLLFGYEANMVGGTPYRPKRDVAVIDAEATKIVLDLIPVFFLNAKSLARTINTLTDAEISDENEALLTNTQGASKLRLTTQRNLIIGARYNIIYSVRKFFRELEVRRYNRRKELRSAQQLRLQELLELRNENGEQPKLERFIKAVEDRITKIDSQITRFEEDHLQDDEGWG